jgi:hypothetical protein
MPRLKTKLVKLRDACEALAISHDTFARHWQSVFTDTRPERRKGVRRLVLEDELSVAVEEGAAAVLTFRKVMGRA